MTTKEIHKYAVKIVDRYTDGVYASVKITKADSHGNYTVDWRNHMMKNRDGGGYHYLIAVNHRALYRVSYQKLWDYYLQNKETENLLNGKTLVFPLKVYDLVTKLTDEDLEPYYQHRQQLSIQKDRKLGQKNMFNVQTGEINE
jgi:hypothetical protein